MRAVMAVLALAAALAWTSAEAQALLRYPGDRAQALAARESSTGPTLAASAAWYGDSITQGACNTTSPPAKLAQLLPGYLVVNRGVSGENASQIVTRYLAGMASDCLGETCGTYLFGGGTNDCGTGDCNTDSVLSTMLTGVDHALTAERQVVWFPPPPFRVAPGCSGCLGGTYAGTLKILEYRAKWQAACASASRPNRHLLTCVDAYAAMESPYEEEADRGYLVDAYACSPTDRVHTSQAGADVLAALGREAFP